MKKNRLERVNSLLKEVIYDVIRKNVKNPHIKTFITVTRVETTPDLHHAKVYLSTIATDKEKAEALKALQSAAGFIAVHASKQTNLPYFPELLFKMDAGLEQHIRIEHLLGQIEQERLAHPTETQAEENSEENSGDDE
jgi:ribosome-binding factor A